MKVTLNDRESFAAFFMRARAKGLSDPKLMSAIEAIPRRAFVNVDFGSIAYGERSIPIECGETIEGLDIQAQLIAALDLQPNQRVLEIGSGSGYTGLVMAKCAARVTSIERYKTLCTSAQGRAQNLGIGNIVFRQEDATKLEPAQGAYDRIISWAAFDVLPRHYVDLLTTQGILIAPIGLGEETQTVAKLNKIGSRFERADIAQVRFQPLVSGLPQHF